MKMFYLVIPVFFLSIFHTSYAEDSAKKVDFTTLSKVQLKVLKREMEWRLKKRTGINFICVMSDNLCVRGLNRLIQMKLPHLKDKPEYNDIKNVFVGQENNNHQYPQLQKHLEKFKDELLKLNLDDVDSRENFIQVDSMWQSTNEIREFLKIPVSKDNKKKSSEIMMPVMLNNKIDKILLGPVHNHCMDCSDNSRITVPCKDEEQFYDKLYKDETVTGTIVIGYNDSNDKKTFKIYDDSIKKLIQNGFKIVKEGKNNTVCELDVFYKGIPKKWRLNVIKSAVKCGFLEKKIECIKKQHKHSAQVLEKFSKSISGENISIYAGHMNATNQHHKNPFVEMAIGPGNSYKLKLKTSNPKAGVVVYNSCWSDQNFRVALSKNYKRENYRIITSKHVSKFGNMPDDIIQMITAILNGRCSGEIEAYINRGRTKVVRVTNDSGMRHLGGLKEAPHFDRVFPGSMKVHKIDAPESSVEPRTF